MKRYNTNYKKRKVTFDVKEKPKVHHVLRRNIIILLSIIFFILSFYTDENLGIFVSVLAFLFAALGYFVKIESRKYLSLKYLLVSLLVIITLSSLLLSILSMNEKIQGSYSKINKEKIYTFNLLNKNFETYTYPDGRAEISFPRVYQTAKSTGGPTMFIGYKPDNLYYTFSSIGDETIIDSTIARFQSNKTFKLLSATKFSYKNQYPAVDIYLSRTTENYRMRIRLVLNNKNYYMMFTDDKDNYNRYFESLSFENIGKHKKLNEEIGCDGTGDYCATLKNIANFLVLPKTN